MPRINRRYQQVNRPIQPNRPAPRRDERPQNGVSKFKIFLGITVSTLALVSLYKHTTKQKSEIQPELPNPIGPKALGLFKKSPINKSPTKQKSEIQLELPNPIGPKALGLFKKSPIKQKPEIQPELPNPIGPKLICSVEDHIRAGSDSQNALVEHPEFSKLIDQGETPTIFIEFPQDPNVVCETLPLSLFTDHTHYLSKVGGELRSTDDISVNFCPLDPPERDIDRLKKDERIGNNKQLLKKLSRELEKFISEEFIIDFKSASLQKSSLENWHHKASLILEMYYTYKEEESLLSADLLKRNDHFLKTIEEFHPKGKYSFLIAGGEHYHKDPRIQKICRETNYFPQSIKQEAVFLEQYKKDLYNICKIIEEIPKAKSISELITIKRKLIMTLDNLPKSSHIGLFQSFYDKPTQIGRV